MLVGPPRKRDTALALARMSRPDQVLLTVVVFGAGVAAGRAPGVRPDLGVALAGAALVLVAASVHVANEYADADTDARTRRTPFSGGSGAMAGLDVSRTTVLVAALVSAASGVLVAAGALLAGVLPPLALLLLGVGLGGGWLYSIGPFAFSRHGWGEVVNAVLGGLLLPVYGVAAVAGQASAADVAVFVPFALVVFVNLLETQWPDRVADRAVGKHTLTSRLSAPAVRRLAAAGVTVAFTLLVVLAPDPLPARVAVASFLALPLSVWGLVRLTRVPDPLPAVLAMITMIVAQGIAWAS